MQARNNARVVFSGSLYFFSDEAFTLAAQNGLSQALHKKTGKQEVALAISQWVFGETGRSRVAQINHHKEGESQPPEQAYTITEHVVYTIVIEELVSDKWVPFKANDVQLEFVSIDPFVTKILKHVQGVRYDEEGSSGRSS